VSAHVVAVGPNAISELCCGRGALADSEMTRAAFDTIDDPVALVDGRPVAVDSLWRAVLRSVDCGSPECAIIVHPSWWAPTRVDVVSAAAQVLADDVVMRPRSWLLAQASPLGSLRATVIVEIADRFVVITGAAVVVERRREEPERIAEAVVHSIMEMTADVIAAVVIDAPRTVGGADALATMIADGLRVRGGVTAVRVDDARFRELAAAAVPDDEDACASQSYDAARDHQRHRYLGLGLVVLLIAALIGMSALGRHPAPVADRAPTTFLVEGRVALEVPAQWPVQRVIAGPGSARMQVTSPSDPEVALHVTQSRVAAETLNATAESLKHAIDAEPVGVFVDFNPAALSAGRPAVTYREVRAGHDIRWTILLDGAVRISIGCQSRPGHDDAVREVCEQAVRSARAIS
jgi:type VII secretion-associated protein (TIGR03931 family)